MKKAEDQKSFVAGRLGRLAREDMARKAFRENIGRLDWKKSTGILLILTALSFITLYCIQHYNHWPPKFYSSQSVFNLSKEKVQWKVSSGDFSLKRSLPLKMFDFPSAELKDYLNLETEFTLPKRITEKDLALHAFYIWTDHFDLWVNEKHIGRFQGGNLNLRLPPLKGQRALKLKLKVKVGEMTDPGIDPYSQVVIGPYDELARVIHETRGNEDIATYWKLIPQMAITFLFAILFFSFSRNLENSVFVYYGFFSSVSVFLWSNLGADSLTSFLPGVDSWLLSQVCRNISKFFLIAFVYNYFRKFDLRAKRVWGYSFFAFLVLVTFAMVLGHHQWLGEAMAASDDYFGYLIGGYAFYLGVTSFLYLRSTEGSRARMFSVAAFTLTMGVSNFGLHHLFAVEGSENLFTDYADLFFFVTLAILVAIDYANTTQVKDRFRTRLNKLVDPRMLKAYARHTNADLTSENELIIVFIDIRSFTQLCEHVAPSIVTDLVNRYFHLVTKCIEEQGGIIDKFMGDGVLAYWGIPELQSEDSRNAIEAMLNLRKQLEIFNHEQRQKSLPEIQVCAAIHRGKAIAGVLGSESKVDYTILGQNVNLTSRVEQLSKVLDADIVLTDSFLQGCDFEVVQLDKGEHKIRGIDGKLRLHSFIGVEGSNGQLITNNQHVSTYYHEVFSLKKVECKPLLRVFDYTECKQDKDAA